MNIYGQILRINHVSHLDPCRRAVVFRTMLHCLRRKKGKRLEYSQKASAHKLSSHRSLFWIGQTYVLILCLL